MRRLHKKGQTEDFIADLIPSMIVIAIGLYIISNMQATNKILVSEKEGAVRYALMEKKDMADYLLLELDSDKGTISLKEMIGLTYKNEKYQQMLVENLKRKDIVKEDAPIETIAGKPKQDQVETIQRLPEQCIRLDIKYPDGSNMEVGGDECTGWEKVFALPTYDGQSITVNATVGTT
ncbi:hypothetical protein FJZ53_04075 [Candidatus Woesearchaeota archaeon]|nr:hypothetical protein [Candidatus Woesearchaeota archaeon]